MDPCQIFNPVSILCSGKIQCQYAADSRVVGSNPGRVNQVIHISSSLEAVGASQWCAIMHLPFNTFIRKARSCLEPGGVSCLKMCAKFQNPRKTFSEKKNK